MEDGRKKAERCDDRERMLFLSSISFLDSILILVVSLVETPIFGHEWN